MIDVVQCWNPGVNTFLKEYTDIYVSYVDFFSWAGTLQTYSIAIDNQSPNLYYLFGNQYCYEKLIFDCYIKKIVIQLVSVNLLNIPVGWVMGYIKKGERIRI